MNPTVYVAIFTWPLVVLFFFGLFNSRRAMLLSMLGAWMFLPMASFQVEGFPNITKMSVTCVSVIIAVIFFDTKRFMDFHWTWWDLPIVGWILAPIPSGVLSEFGLYEGISGSIENTIGWGLPYLLGRLYFPDHRSLHELAIALFLAGVVYLPFVLFEVRMSPQLHAWVYGYYQHSFGQTKRFGGWRPTVFMQHGLAVGLFMATASVCGLCLYSQRALKQIYSLPVLPIVFVVIFGTLLCKSTLAIGLMMLSISIFILSATLRTKLLILFIAIVPIAYLYTRTIGNWNAQIFRDFASLLDQERLESVETRLGSEEALWRWIQGNVTFGRTRLEALLEAPREIYGRFIPDALWLITLGKYGMVGLMTQFAVLLSPCFLYLYRFRTSQIFSPTFAGATTLCMIVAAYSLDNLMNAMVNPMYLIAVGGLVGIKQGTDAEDSIATLSHR